MVCLSTNHLHVLADWLSLIFYNTDHEFDSNMALTSLIFTCYTCIKNHIFVELEFADLHVDKTLEFADLHVDKTLIR